MSNPLKNNQSWLSDWMETHRVPLWGVADLRHMTTPPGKSGQGFPTAISLAIPMNPEIMASVQKGPNQDYAVEYTRVNHRINALSASLAAEIKSKAYRALALAASVRSDPVKIEGDFPHKTAATRAGLGWIGRHCQLITRPFGSWIRLGTVFTDMALPCGPPLEKNHCGRCMRCVEACPARALKGAKWRPGLPREEILDVQACDQWKKTHYFQFHKGHNCGICTAVCPYGLKTLKKPKEGSPTPSRHTNVRVTSGASD